jgi:pilus assembly protein CpaD
MTTVLSSHVDRASRSCSRAALIACGIALALGGCSAVDRHEIVGSVPLDYRDTHPITIQEMVDTFDLPIGIDMARLTGPMRSNVLGFAQKFVASGSTTIAVVSPSGSPNQAVAAVRTLEVRDILLAAGISRRAIEFRVYEAGAEEANAPIRLAYNRVAAQTAPCGAWPDQVAHSDENRNYYNFGCATQQNLAAIVANPLDLLYPRAISAADAERRATVLSSYRNGKGFQGDYKQEPGGTVATGVGGT